MGAADQLIADRERLNPGDSWIYVSRDMWTGEKRLVVRLVIAKPHPNTIERHILTCPTHASGQVCDMVVQDAYVYTIIEPRVGTK